MKSYVLDIASLYLIVGIGFGCGYEIAIQHYKGEIAHVCPKPPPPARVLCNGIP